MILTFAVNGTLLDETPFFEKLKALAETLKVKKQKLENAKKLEESLNPSKISKLLESELAQA